MSKINLNGSKRAERREREEAVFRKKVAIQQFMNHNAPLFRAFALKGEDAAVESIGDVLKETAGMANKLAVSIASKVHGKAPNELSSAEIRPFRTEAAEYVAARWAADRKIDIEAAAREVAAAVDLADSSWDHDMYADENISDHASLMMTVVGLSRDLSRLVNVYDFRLGRTEALLKLLSKIVDTSVKAARDMLKDSSPSAADERNLTQTLARNFTSLMEVCYDRKAKEVVLFLKDKTPEEKRAFYATRSPIDEVLADFDVWYVSLSGWAVAAAREMSPAPRAQSPAHN
jgi:hypothetical protein